MARLATACICAALLCIVAASSVSAQSPPPAVSLPPPNLDGNAGKFSGFNESAYKFEFKLPNATTTAVVANTSPVHLPAGIRSNLFSMRPCSYGTVPHYHANAAEYFFAVRGKTRVFVYVNGKLIEHTIEAGYDTYSTHIAPKGQLHWYFNDECERSVMLAVLNPPEDVPAAFAGYFLPLPKAFTDGRVTVDDVKSLIASGFVKPGGSGPTTFDLTNNCLKKCKKYGRHGGGHDDYDEDYEYKGHSKSFKKRHGKGGY
jgi:hypothetical protein